MRYRTPSYSPSPRRGRYRSPSYSPSPRRRQYRSPSYSPSPYKAGYRSASYSPSPKRRRGRSPSYSLSPRNRHYRSPSYSPSPRRASYYRRRSVSSPSDSQRGRYGGQPRKSTTSLLVRNLHPYLRVEDLRGRFREFGPINDIYLPRDYYTGREEKLKQKKSESCTDLVIWCSIMTVGIAIIFSMNVVGIGIIFQYGCYMARDNSIHHFYFFIFCFLLCREPRGFGFVQFFDPAHAAEAKYYMDRQIVHGREIAVVFAEESRKTPHEMWSRQRSRYGSYHSRSYERSISYSRSRFRSLSRSRSLSPRRRHNSRSVSPYDSKQRGGSFSYSSSSRSSSRRVSLSRSRSATPEKYAHSGQKAPSMSFSRSRSYSESSDRGERYACTESKPKEQLRSCSPSKCLK